MDKIFWCVVFLLTITVFGYSKAESPGFRRERFRSNFFARQEFAEPEPVDNSAGQAPYSAAQTPYSAAQTPYPAAGYRPVLPFNLPTEERRVEQEVASAPAFIPPTPAPTFAPAFIPPTPVPTFAPIPAPAFAPVPKSTPPTPSIARVPVQTYGAPPKEYGPPPVQSPLPEFDESSGEEPVNENDFEAFDVQGNQIQRLQDEQQVEEDEEDDRDEDNEDDDKGLYYVQLPTGLSQQVSYLSNPANSQVLSKIRLAPVVQTHQPLVLGDLVAPKSFAYTSQYQSW